MDEAIAFVEDNGFTFTEAQKEEIRKKTAGLATSAKKQELTPDDLEAAAGGWDWTNFFAVGGTGGVVGAILGAAAVVALASNPVGWVVAAGAAGGAVATGGLLGTAAAVANDVPVP